MMSYAAVPFFDDEMQAKQRHALAHVTTPQVRPVRSSSLYVRTADSSLRHEENGAGARWRNDAHHCHGEK